MAELAKHDPDAFVVYERAHPMYPDLVAPVQHAVARPARDFGGYRNLDFVLERALTPGITGGDPVRVVVLGHGRPTP